MSEISIFKERILQYLDNKGVSKYEFYAETGVSNSVLSKKGGLSEDNTLKFLSYYTDVNPVWFFTGQGEMLKGNNHISMVSEPGLQYGNEKSLPLISIDAMAGYANNPGTVFEMDCERYIVPVFKGADFLIPVRGNSMQPRYNSGDIVACKKLSIHDVFFQWGKVYVLDTEQGAMLKRIQQGPDDEHILVVSDNNELYKPFSLHLSKINAIAIVCGIIRLV